ncbi:hypothetical protein [Streptomyces sp. NPDC057403]|uniref:hypothetical protein n=1 Tax=Streptomyces sp. NPDC057403 TaxID=3346119 RepID=UPI0036C675FB
MADVASNAHEALIELLREPARKRSSEGTPPPATSEWASYMDRIAARAETDTDDDSSIYLHNEEGTDDEDEPAPATRRRPWASPRIARRTGGLAAVLIVAISVVLMVDSVSSGIVVSTTCVTLLVGFAAITVMRARLTGHRRRARDGSTHHRTWLLQR